MKMVTVLESAAQLTDIAQEHQHQPMDIDQEELLPTIQAIGQDQEVLQIPTDRDLVFNTSLDIDLDLIHSDLGEILIVLDHRLQDPKEVIALDRKVIVLDLEEDMDQDLKEDMGRDLNQVIDQAQVVIHHHLLDQVFVY